ncbi:MAG TPA: GTP 3',8-cyclase MoaA [Bryobacteraceae bacterium]|jgi:cyclic pyranopterin phosphate synthase
MSAPLIDTFGRLHDNLRISVTDRCNIRCFYCMPEDVKFGPREEILSFEEIGRFVTIAAQMGVRKLRITGGEPLLRKNLPDLIAKLLAIPGIEDLAMTTNGVTLKQHARDLYDSGLRRLNVHLDTLDRERFLRITRRDDLPKVLDSLAHAKELGFGPIKINVVAVTNLIEPDVVPMARFGREHGFEIRYIEFMPLDSQGIWDHSRVLLASDMIRMLEREIAPLEAIPDTDPRAPATEYSFTDTGARIGFVASVSKPFCMNCNRIRLTADGKLRNCLFAIEETDVRELLRSGGSDAQIREALRSNIRSKWMGHQINTQQFIAPPRPMYAIGG